MEFTMGAAYAFIFLHQLNRLGAGASARHPRVDRIRMDGLAHFSRRAQASSIMGLDSGLLHLAIVSIQPNHALSAADLSALVHDGGVGGF